jgi:hypothetical protein
LLLGLLRLAHALAAALWVGSALISALSLAGGTTRPSSPLLHETFGAGVAVFVLTGTVLAFQRLSSAPVPPTYPALLAVKVVLGVWMFSLAKGMGSPRPARLWLGISLEQRLAAVGIAIYALAIALRAVYEGSIQP